MMNLVTPMIYYPNDEFSLQLWIFITLMNFHHSEDVVQSQSWTFSQCLILIIMMNFDHNVDFSTFDEFSSQWWIFIRMNFHHNDEFSSQWWIFITMLIFQHLMNFHQKYLYNHSLKYSSIDEFYPNDEYSIEMINFPNND